MEKLNRKDADYLQFQKEFVNMKKNSENFLRCKSSRHSVYFARPHEVARFQCK